MSSSLTLSFPNSTLALTLTSAQITESFDDILKVECEAYYEGIQERLNEALSEIKDFFYASLTLTSPIASKRIASGTQNFFLVGENLSFLQNTTNESSLNQKFFFSFTLFSPLILLKYNTSSRIFCQQSVVDVASNILCSYAPLLQKEIDCSLLQGHYPPLEYLTQYQEDDLSFLYRLCFNSGIFLLERGEKIYLCDTPFITQGENASASYESLMDQHSFSYKNNLNNPLSEEFFFHLSFFNSLSTKSALFSSFNPSTPSLFQSKASLSLNSEKTQFSLLSHFSAHHSSLSFYEELQTHLLSLRSQMQNYTFTIKSNILDLKVGDEVQIRSLSSSPLPDTLKSKEEKYKIISITHKFKDEANLSSTFTGNGESSYENTLLLLPLSIPFFTQPLAKPRVYGGVLGLVVGENSNTAEQDFTAEKNTIHTDSQGRIKVAFAYSLAQALLDQKRFEQEGIHQSLNTCYLRVLSPIASENAGFFAIPRIGDEVLIQFLEGDCDKPIVAGSFYNSSSPIPQDHHFTSLSASTLGKENSNKRSEITLNPTQEREEIYIHAQKDRKAIINNDDEELIKHNKKSTIKGTKTTHIALASIENVGGLKDVNVGAESMENVILSKDTQVGGSYTINVGEEFEIRIAGELKEYIGESKEVKIAQNLTEEIFGHKENKISGNKIDHIENDYQLNAQGNIELESQGQIHLKTKENLDLQSEHFSILGKETATVESKTCNISTQEGANLEDQKEITLKVKEGIINIQNDRIILKAGGVEVTIGKDGLVVKGGEIKSE